MRGFPALRAPFAIAVAAATLGCHLAIAARSRDAELLTQRRRTVQAIDWERRRIQRDLHDTAQQRILSIRLRLSTLAAEAHVDRAAIATLAPELDAVLADIRAAAVTYSPELVRRRGLPAALHVDAARAPIDVQIDAPDFGRLAPELERQIYYCCLEALQNVLKHSGARHAWIRLRRKPDAIRFEVVDDGRGLDLSRATIGQGLRNMADRLWSLGGRLSISANPGGGTCVRGEIPIRESGARQRLPAVRLPERPLRALVSPRQSAPRLRAAAPTGRAISP
jgi:signal transduction histidine kinase